MMDKWAVWASDQIEPPTIKIHREDSKGVRFYWWDDGGIQTGAGITSLIGAVMPESKFLTDWKLKYGNKWEQVFSDTAEYGTLMHTAFLSLMARLDIAPLMDAMREISIRNGQSYDQPEKNIYSFLKFAEDYKVNPLIFEGQILDKFNGGNYCMTIDLLCEATVIEKTKLTTPDGVYSRGVNKGQPRFIEETIKTEKKIKMVVDFKSNYFEKEKKAFYDTHHYQLIAAKRAVKRNFNIDVERICNFAPNNWRTEPSYTLHEWDTTDRDISLFNAYMELARLRGLFTPSGKKFISKGFEKSSEWAQLDYVDYVKVLLNEP